MARLDPDSLADREPDWTPLEAVLPLEHCAGFMFMGYATAGRGTRIRLYKHGITRRYLMLDERCRPYTYTERGEYVAWPYGLESAIDRAFEGIEQLDATRSTAYDDVYIAERDAALAAAGWRVITMKLEAETGGAAQPADASADSSGLTSRTADTGSGS